MNDSLKICLADDDEDDLELLSTALAKSGIKCDLNVFQSGIALIAFLESATWNPDYIFLDLNMPLIDGLSTLKMVRAMPQYANTKVIIYSTSNSAADCENTFSAGANLYIMKPNNFSILKTMLSNLFTSGIFSKPVSRENFIYYTR